MQGREKFRIIPIEDLSNAQIESLTLLYQSIAQVNIVQFYLSLAFLGRRTNLMNCGELATMLNVSIDSVDEMRKECESLSLLKTYFDLKEYTFQIVEPLKPYQFLQHEFFGRYYYQKFGADSFYKMMDVYGVSTEIDTASKNISASFDIRVFNSWNERDEKEYLTTKSSKHKDDQTFYIQTFIHHLSPLIFPLELRNPEILTTIEHFGNLYHVSYEKMKTYVGRSIDHQNLLFDVKKLERMIRQMPVAVDEKIEDVYLLSPFEFLQLKQPNIPIALADKRLIEKLLTEYDMRKEVVNVLLEHALNKNNQELNGYIIEQEAAVWVRRGVKSKEDALEQVNTSSKKSVNYSKKKKTVPQPVYQNTNHDDSELEAIKQRLKK